MEQHVRVELIPRMVPVDEVTQAERAETVQHLAKLGQIDPSQGQIADQMQDGWLARINGVEFPVSDYGVGPIEGSTQALVSLLVPADSLQVGEPSTAVQEPQVRPAVPEPKRASSWGAPGPDPREGIPGWPPTLGEQVAENAAKTSAVVVVAHFDGHPMHRDAVLGEMRDQIRVRSGYGPGSAAGTLA
jgi:hypothetical protein